MGCFCDFFEDSKCLWIVIIALILLYCNGCGCGSCGGNYGGRRDGCGCGCD